MTTLGYLLTSEEFHPNELVRQAVRAEAAGFERLWISDHFHPWSEQQGHSPFVWSVIGALSQACSLPVTMAVTCPIMRIHPAVIAQAAATAAAQLDGRFVLGVGTGEALNEHITGQRWPTTAVRRDMLEEAVSVIRKLFSGKEISHHGRYFTVENARLYTLPSQPAPIYISGYGARAAGLAGRIGDGFQCTMPSAELVSQFRQAGGAGKPTQAGFKVCHASTRQDGLRTAHSLWANEQLPGQLGQILPTPRDFEQAASLVPESAVEQAVPCGPDAKAFVDRIREFADAGFDEVYVQQIGPDQDRFFDFWESEIAPELAA
ncbi:TIGR03557 family F420-dependent LLM class oxidoreductase [Mycobacterium branderi]|uniref:LLM class F420-dependent oxidoreductase n=1 Tax=Mycobacterium branderi TaxID=43348 RepID=A0A7I7WBU9_9MYCO|nr:TIGR03557 family F420-dependent LLM class oxidoreductase [Mycobacterium branderi]MCV7232247.1 TIGR03557 family F420-dependent LLM class oxidoreductase [Mycobacterium branderi]ORA36167.1 LLM class F420-dependent oxidoreductase [Mycobacterium branderi]BBZ14265.1 LLM class F420-dependent oxidoreductase [Mycobacterium branderi]